MAPTVDVLVLPGSLFCIKVLCAMHYKGVPYRLVPVHPAKLKKELPPPHQVPVLRDATTLVPDSAAILRHLDTRHPTAPDGASRPLYPPVEAGRAAGAHWLSVAALEQFAHDELSMLYNYFGAATPAGQRAITRPFVRSLLPRPLAALLPCLPALGARAAEEAILKRVTPVLGKDAVASEEAATARLVAALRKLETAFADEAQMFLFATDGPTAADFGVFAALKRLLHPLPDVAGGVGPGCPDALEKAGGLPRLKAFFENMDKLYYHGKVDWSKATL